MPGTGAQQALTKALQMAAAGRQPTGRQFQAGCDLLAMRNERQPPSLNLP
jgi:hypothetical protein